MGKFNHENTNLQKHETIKRVKRLESYEAGKLEG